MVNKFDSLESLCELIVDCPHSTPKWTDEGIVVLRNQNIRNGVLDLSTPSYTNEEDYQKRIKRAVPQAGDIVFTREAPMGEVCIIPEGLKCCLGQRQVLLRPKKDVSGEYLFWALQSPHVQHQISWNEGTGTTVSNVRIPVLKALQIPRHPADESEVATYLTNLASKIELNRQTNQTLEQMAKALFKSWFVDFDPVFDNALANGMAVNDFPEALQKKALLRQQQRQQAPSAGQEQQQITNGEPSADKKDEAKPLPEDIQQLFPNEFEQTHVPSIGINGWIPKGWKPKVLSDLLDVKYGKDHKKLDEGSYPVYGSGGLMRNVDKFLYEGESVLIPRKGTLTNIMYVNETFWTVDTMFFTKPKMNNVAKFTFYLLKRLDFNNMNVGSAVPSMTTKVLNALQVVYPSGNVLSVFDELVELYFSKTRSNNENTKQLEKLRDTLLPKLISGELTLPADNSIATAATEAYPS